MPLMARAYQWDPGKMGYGEGVREEGTRKKRQGAGGFAAGSLHARLGVGSTHSCASFSRPGGRTIVSISLMEILWP